MLDLEKDISGGASKQSQDFVLSRPLYAQQPLTRSLWEGWNGSTIMLFGIVLPTLAMAGAAFFAFIPALGLILRHPIETLLQYALAACIPIGNFVAWQRIMTQNYRHSSRIGLLNGLSVGASALVTVACSTVCFLGTQGHLVDSVSAHGFDFQVVGLIAIMSLLVSLHLAVRLRYTWETQSAQMWQTVYSLLGVALSFFVVAASEVRPSIIKMAEQAAVSGSEHDKKESLNLLRRLNCEKDLSMDIASPSTGGLAGLFLQVAPDDSRQLYFAVTGEPYNDNKGGAEIISNMPDSYLGHHVVGTVIPGLSLKRSELSGTVNGQSLTSSLDWTYVFKNGTSEGQEARAELMLPPGAVISNMTLWEQGEPKEASIGVTEQAKGAYKWVVGRRRDPALVTDLGHGRVLVQCYPVPPHAEMKLRVSLKAPLKLNSGIESTLTLPRFISTNFKIAGHHDLRLRSEENLAIGVVHAHSVKTATGSQLLIGSLKDDDIIANSVAVRVSRPNTFIAVAAPDFKQGGYVVESIKHTMVKLPTHLVVCVDGSENIKEHVHEIKTALKTLPKSIPTSVIIATANDDRFVEPASLDVTLARLRSENFLGGQDNLPAVIKATELAGESPNGAVLWIHGPQPSNNQDIYITSRFVNPPSFYELAIDDGITNSAEFFKNHRDIGPFVPVARNSTVTEDLSRFIAQWRPDSRDYYLQYWHMNYRPSCEIISTRDSAEDLGALYAAQEVRDLVRQHRVYQAARVAAEFHLVTPITAAVVLERSSDYQRYDLREQRRDENRDSQLASSQGSSGTGSSGSNFSSGGDIFSSNGPGPSGGMSGRMAQDGSFVTGVNTAGTVRVNNLANLEAMLSLIANSIEILGLAVGASLFINALFSKNCLVLFGLTLGQTRITRFALAAFIVLLGLCAPGLVNGFVASARDANLFS